MALTHPGTWAAHYQPDAYLQTWNFISDEAIGFKDFCHANLRRSRRDLMSTSVFGAALEGIDCYLLR